MKNRKRNIFSILFNSMDFLRKLILNLLFWGILAAVVLSFFPQVHTVSDGSVLMLQPSGIIVERNEGSELPDWFRNFTSSPLETTLLSLSRSIRTAADDRRISALFLDLSYLQYASLAALQELESDIHYFRERGKKVIAWSSYYNLYGAYLASAADHVYLDPMGTVHLPGYSVYRTYMGEALDEWMIDVSYFHAGEFKSYGDSYISSSMSRQMKEENQRWLDSLWSQYLDRMGENRGITASDLTDWINAYPRLLEIEGLTEAEAAIRGGLVDGILTGPGMDRELIRLCGVKRRDMVSSGDYAHQITSSSHPGEKRVVVVTASGTIHSGESDTRSIGADTLISSLDRISSDKSTGAIVLRLDTGGGSAYASEQIRRKLEEIRKQGVKVVVSMGGVTASGGYWIASGADEIWSAPGTITGSIGVFTMIPKINRLAEEKLQLHSDGVGTTWMSGQERLDQPLNSSSRAVFQSSVDRTYDHFLALVSDSRGLSVDNLKPLAEGRIWSGEEALGNGLADRTGSLTQVADGAAALAGLDSYSVEYYREEPVSVGSLINSLSSGGIRGSIRGAVEMLFPVAGNIKEDIFSLAPGRVYALSFVNNK